MALEAPLLVVESFELKQGQSQLLDGGEVTDPQEILLQRAIGPPPKSVTALAWLCQAQWLVIVWGYWVDKHRHAISN